MSGWNSCSYCSGTGQMYDGVKSCGSCGGSGAVAGQTCGSCWGTGSSGQSSYSTCYMCSGAGGQHVSTGTSTSVTRSSTKKASASKRKSGSGSSGDGAKGFWTFIGLVVGLIIAYNMHATEWYHYAISAFIGAALAGSLHKLLNFVLIISFILGIGYAVLH